MQEFIDAVESTYTYIGGALAVIYGVTLIVWFLRRRNAAVEDWWQRMRPRLGLPLSDRAKKTIVWLVSVLSVALYIYCTVCTKADTETKGEHAPVIWDILVSFSIKVLPFFVFGCVLSASVPQEWLAVIREYGGEMAETYGVPVEELQESIRHGVRKINIDTDIRLAMTGAIRRALATDPSQFDPRGYLKEARAAARELCTLRYEQFGAAGNASRIQVKPLEDIAALYRRGGLS